MKKTISNLSKISVAILVLAFSCKELPKKDEVIPGIEKQLTAAEILGNSGYQAISYGGYRHADHGMEPTVEELKEDMKILASMNIKILRTYKVHLPHAANVLRAITELKQADPKFEMYVMLGAWIDCKNAWTDLEPDHEQESERNAIEIAEAVRLAKQYPDIVKVIAVGNEAMVKWAMGYYVQPGVILKWVNHLQDLKSKGELSKDLWITSSDNFASWGGGDAAYHVEDLNSLIAAVDYISMHTYPMHDTHYNPDFWGVMDTEANFSEQEKIKAAMLRAKAYAQNQYSSVVAYMKSLGIDKPVHIGETGWASFSNGFYGDQGSKACDQYKVALFYNFMRDWTNGAGISCFYFEAFDEPWKDAVNPGGSENHFGLFSVDGEAKYVIWDLVDKGTFDGLTRGGNEIVKSFNGNFDDLMSYVKTPSSKPDMLVNHQ